jgi:hypothetical protein
MRRESSQENLLRRVMLLVLASLAFACPRAEPLTAHKAEEILRGYQFANEPIYAEVPQRVWWSPKSPQDDYDVKALETLRNLERAGDLTITESHDPDGTTSYTGKVTPKGFPILGTAPSQRGPCFRATICFKKYDGLRDFVRHPTDPTVGHANLIWHYERPTPMYDFFTTKIDKPLNKPFASAVSFYWKDHAWHFDVMVRKSSVAYRFIRSMPSALAMIASVASVGKNPVSTTPAQSRILATTTAMSFPHGTRTSMMRCPSSVTCG